MQLNSESVLKGAERFPGPGRRSAAFPFAPAASDEAFGAFRRAAENRCFYTLIL